MLLGAAVKLSSSTRLPFTLKNVPFLASIWVRLCKHTLSALHSVLSSFH